MFHSEIEISDLYPDAYALACNENKTQYPNAKFVAAASGRYIDNRDDTIEVMFLYDIGNPDTYLWVYLPGMLDPDYLPDRFFIDEYYELNREDAMKYLSDI